MDTSNKILIGVYFDFNSESPFSDSNTNDTLTYTAEWKVADSGTYAPMGSGAGLTLWM